MKTRYTATAIIQQDGEWWVGWVEEVPGAIAQERNKPDLLISLREAAQDILEIQRRQSRQRAASGYEEIPLMV